MNMRAPLLAILTLAAVPARAETAVLTGPAAYGDWHGDAPGVRRLLSADTLAGPYATPSESNTPSVVARPEGATPRVPAGFSVSLWASGLQMPRVIRTAPNGDVFLAESGADRVRVFPVADGAARAPASTVFAHDVAQPFGIAFWPPRAPSFVYVAGTDRVVRYPYRAGDTVAHGPAQVVVASLPEGGHWTRDLAVAPDGARLFVSIGSASNVATGMPAQPPVSLAEWQAAHGVGAAWGAEQNRAVVLQFDPEGSRLRPFATGLRNCSGLAIQPAGGAVWCATNERDGLGDNLPPDYATSVQEGGFYGWPWYYEGDHEDPRLRGRRPDLAGHAIVPDVLIQPHSAPLGITFYDGTAFPAAYRGDAFVALHGSWNRAKRTGYKVVRLHMEGGRPTGEYEDFLTGFVANENSVWARPVALTVVRDGSLLVTEDGNGTIWRIAH